MITSHTKNPETSETYVTGGVFTCTLVCLSDFRDVVEGQVSCHSGKKLQQFVSQLHCFLITVHSEVLTKADRRCKSPWFFDINIASIHSLLDNLRLLWLTYIQSILKHRLGVVRVPVESGVNVHVFVSGTTHDIVVKYLDVAISVVT